MSTQEEKQLLVLVDLCSRLPYGTICEDIYGNLGTLLDLAPELNSVTLKISELGSTWTTDIDKVKPYLRPMSSMTEEEKKKVCSLNGISLIELNERLKWDIYIKVYTIETFDYFNAKHLDYRGLIEKDLAKEAPEGMYKI